MTRVTRSSDAQEGVDAIRAEIAAHWKRFGPYMGLAEGVCDVIGILRSRPASGGGGPNIWDRVVGIIAEHGSLPEGEVKAIVKAIARAYCGWSDAQRRSIWHETDSGIDDDDDDSPCDTSLNGIGRALQVEMLEEATRTAWREAKKLKKAAGKRAPAARKRGIGFLKSMPRVKAKYAGQPIQVVETGPGA
ncbi:MAG: hypothetical protein A3G41_08035 [Elusimicrobia bacterium RIFCSPLOWO2_12_FULL_59_9]|nr:MAG: hypothetical protein A3G41_08035 [Elusimicrobia bacterium RIFCSPLOWO2_12_FULL_59_9]